MKSVDLIVPVFLIIGAVLVAPHLTWAEAKPMAQICLVVAFVFMIILWWIR